MAAPALITVARFIASSGVGKAIQKYGKKAVDAARKEYKDLTTKPTKGQEDVRSATRGQRATREARREGAVVGSAVGAGAASGTGSSKKSETKPRTMRLSGGRGDGKAEMKARAEANKPKTFKAAFRDAKDAGKKTFMFEGKKYTTETKTETKRAAEVKPKTTKSKDRVLSTTDASTSKSYSKGGLNKKGRK